MSKRMFLFMVLASCAVLGCMTSNGMEGLQAKSNKLPSVIVYAVDSIESEQKAAEELKEYLSKITGGDYLLQAEDKALNGAPAIYIGQTVFARKAGLDFASFAEEEYALQTVGSNLVISGGRPKGTWNAVCHFLQRELGCRFFTWDCEVIPRQRNLQLPQLDLRRTPSFVGRSFFTYLERQGYTPEENKKVSLFFARNYMNRNGSAFDRVSKSRDATDCHNEYFWVDPQIYAMSNPEFFSNKGKFNDSSKIGARNQEGNLCWTSPKVAEITLAKLRDVIKKDRSELPPIEWPRVYQVSQNDTSTYCRCQNCESVFAAEGSRMGSLLQYVNFVAKGIASEYPDVQIMTFAYIDNENAPKTIRPSTNVLIQWCDLYSRSDCYRPLTNTINADRKFQLDTWKKTGANIAVWDYWNMGMGNFFIPPRIETMIDAIAPDFRLFNEAGAKYLFLEGELCHRNPQNFFDLQVYLGSQLAADVTLSEETLIKEYLLGCYGSAAPAMEEFLTMLRQAVKNMNSSADYVSNLGRYYTDGAFLEKVYRLLKKAQASVPVDSAYYRRVQQEMITPLAVILENPQYDFYQRTGFRSKDIIEEYRIACLSRIEQPWISTVRQAKDKLALGKYIEYVADYNKPGPNYLTIPLPEQFKKYTDIRRFAWPQMRDASREKNLKEFDPGSETGRAIVGRGGEEMHDLAAGRRGLFPNNFGIYSETDKRSASVISTAVPQDEKYHWYKINAFEFGPNTYLWGFYWLCQIDFSSVYSPADGLPGYNIWETWISVKYTGPAYVKGSTQKNGVFLDQSILVKPEARKDANIKAEARGSLK
ncbi:MAG: DUF4838 domain-containing protein [Lentisphaerota bacterium]